MWSHWARMLIARRFSSLRLTSTGLTSIIKHWHHSLADVSSVFLDCSLDDSLQRLTWFSCIKQTLRANEGTLKLFSSHVLPSKPLKKLIRRWGKSNPRTSPSQLSCWTSVYLNSGHDGRESKQSQHFFSPSVCDIFYHKLEIFLLNSHSHSTLEIFSLSRRLAAVSNNRLATSH